MSNEKTAQREKPLGQRRSNHERSPSGDKPHHHRRSSTKKSKSRPHHHHPSEDRKPHLSLSKSEHGWLEVLNAAIPHATYVVFDLEMTGGNPEKNSITEICALKWKNGEVVDKFYTLVNPGRKIPPIVRRLTGITQELVSTAPPIEDVLPKFLEFAGKDSVMVSHNAPGDMVYLKYYSQKVCGQPFSHFFICTHLLAAKLLPESPDKSLKGLAKFINAPHVTSHRAIGDAEHTLELFKVLMEKMEQTGCRTIRDCVRFQGDFDSAIRLGWSISPEKLFNIPTGMGVYYLFDRERKLIFLSSALSLQKEISRLQKTEQVPKSLLKLVVKASDLQYERTPNILALMLAECVGLEGTNVHFNPSQFHQRQVQVFAIGEDHGRTYLRLGPPEEGARKIFGPVQNIEQATDLMEAISKFVGQHYGKKGILITPEKEEIICNLFSLSEGSNPNKLKSFMGKLKDLFLKKSSEDTHLLAKMQALHEQNSLQSLDQWTGVAIATDEGNTNWQIYQVVNGIPKFMMSFRGDWRDKFLTGGFGKRLIQQLEKEQEKTVGPLSAFQARRLNAFLWWYFNISPRDEGGFLSLTDLRGHINAVSIDAIV